MRAAILSNHNTDIPTSLTQGQHLDTEMAEGDKYETVE